MAEPTLADVRELSVRLLARREHSALELRRKLRQRGCDEALIEEALSQLQQERLQSDRRFAEEYARSRCNQGYGPLRIEAELRERGVDARIDELLELDEQEWRELAAEVRRKRFGNVAPSDLRERSRQYRYLGQRGFTSDQIKRALASAGPDQELNHSE